ncbi:MAG: nucleotide exchange factor GrpE [Gammaproteobacteria bacterium]|nr:nucleotide exchange factor GrpE [Gammaproteobacteria bacterium]
MNSENDKDTSNERETEPERQEVNDSADEMKSDPEEKEEDEVTEAVDDAHENEARAELLQDKLLRAQAEIENIRRRSAKESEAIRKFAIERLARDLLPVLDSLEKAIEACGDTDSEDGNALAEGVQLSLKLFIDILEKEGLSLVDPIGEPFDPQFHEALTVVPNPDMEANSVMEVVQKGYILNGRVIRAAKVVVTSDS